MDVHQRGENEVEWEMSMLHLEKLSQAPENLRTLKQKAGEEKARTEKDFFCFGYYDRLTYIKEGDNKPFKYEDAFAISYPYTKTNQPIYADQLFSLLERGNEDALGSIFLCDKADPQKYPFLGILLINISLDKEKMKEGFEIFLQSLNNRLTQRFKEETKFSDDKITVCYSTNCADLCVVIRSDCLEHIYDIKRNFSRYANTPVNRQDEGQKRQNLNYAYQINEHVAVECGNMGDDILCAEQIMEKNKDHKIEIRLRCSDATVQELKKVAGVQLYGSMGNGEYTVLLKYGEFAKAYPVYWSLKEGIYDNKDKDSIQVPGIKNSALSRVLFEARDDIELVYERWNIYVDGNSGNCDGNAPENQWKAKRELLKERSKLCKLMDTAVNNLLSGGLKPLLENNPNFPEQRFREQVILMKDLLYTYNTLWYDETTLFKGRIFYAQVSALLSGIGQQTEIIQKYASERIEYESKKRDAVLHSLNNDLIVYMNIMISAINNFNKLAQAVNHSVRNVPNYEMQSKVNVEKYIYAYTSYLMEICKGFSRAINEQKMYQKMVFPMMTIDLSVQKIQANTLFFVPWNLGLGRESNYMNVFAVNCPNYQRFANVYHVLPMITHEISHRFRYTSREERNKFVIGYLPCSVALELTTRLLQREFKAEEYIVNDEVVKVVYSCLKNELVNFLKKEMGDSLKEIRLHNLRKICQEKLAEYLDIDNHNVMSERRLWDESNRILLELFRYLRIMYVTPKMVSENTDRYAAYIIPNLVLDILNEEKERVRQWKALKDSRCLGNTPFAYIQGEMDRMLEEVGQIGDTFTVTHSAVSSCMHTMAHLMWRGFCEEHTQVKDIICGSETCFKLIQEFPREIFKGQAEQNRAEEILIEEMEKCKIDENSKICVKKHLWETAAYIHELQQQWTVYGGEKITKRKSGIDEYGKLVHASLKSEFEKRISNIRENVWIATQKMGPVVAQLGILNERPDQFTKRLREQLEMVSLSHLTELMQDQMKLYEEVFADLGMCCSFRFTAFGYFVYTIHLFLKERELSESIAHDMTIERMRRVIDALWSYDYKAEKEQTEEQTKEWTDFYGKKVSELEKSIIDYWNTLRDRSSEVNKAAAASAEAAGDEIANLKSGKFAEMIKGVIEHLKELSDFGKSKKEVLMHLRMLQWMGTLYCRLQMDTRADLWDDTGLEEHLKTVYGVMASGNFFEEIRKQDTVKMVGGYFNQFAGSVLKPESKKLSMERQNKFVMTYYAKMQDICIGMGRVEDNIQKNNKWQAKEYSRAFWNYEEEEQ